MNTLSWLLWLGDVSGSLSRFFGFLCFPLALVAGFCICMGVSEMFKHAVDSDDYKMASRTKNLGFRLFLPLFVLSAVIACILPSKETVYLIAASEAGEAVVTSPTGQKALDAVNRYLDDMNPDKDDDKE